MYEYFGCEHLAQGLPTIDDVRPAEGLCHISSGGDVPGASNTFADEIAATVQSVDSTIKKLAMGNLEFFEACTPGYYNNEGSPGSGKGIADQQYGEGPVAFYQLVTDWQKEGSMEGLSLK